VQDTVNKNNIRQMENGNQTLTARDLIWLCLSRWYWFVISLAVFCGIAVWYIMKTPPVYERSASLLIKDDRLGGTAGGDVGASFSGMSFLQANTNVLNELASLTSPTTMTEVVKRLGLNVSYSTPGSFHKRTLYGSTLPMIASFPDLNERESGSFQAVLSPDGTVTLTEFAGKGTKFENAKPVKGHWTDIDTLQTPLGRVALMPNPRWNSSKLQEPLEINVSRAPISTMARAYSSALIAPPPEDYGSILELKLKDVCPERAEDLLSTLIDVYNENWIRDKNRIAVSTSEFIRDRLGVIESELGNVDNDISSYKSTHMTPDVNQASALYFSRAAEANDEVVALNNRLSMANYIRSYLTNSANSFNVLPANAGLENLNIESQISAYNTRLLERNNLVENSSTSNPLVVDMDNQLAGMRQAILASIDNYVVTLNSEVTTAERSRAAATSRLQANPTQARYLLSVERQQKVKESLYLYLLQKREENELSQAFTAYNTRVITPPTGSDAPVAPVRRNIMAMAVLLGLLVPLGGIYISQSLNTKVRGRRDLESLTVPFLGEIPLGYKPRRGFALLRPARDGEQDKRAVLVHKGSGNAINEAFRVMRTNLELMADADIKGAHVLAITSANPGSGKTFIAMNLATVLAARGMKVAVVDLDLRKASLSAYASSPATGISACLAGHADPQSIVVHNVNDTEGLDLYPAGAIPPNPAELLYSPRLKAMIDSLREKYDYVILDCPPVEVVADAKIINTHADMTLFVIRAGLLEREILPQIQQFYNTGRYHSMAIVLNGTETSAHHSRYGYGYGYAYGYGYGHESHKHSK